MMPAPLSLRVWVSKLRHRYGFGVHSPFGYRLVKDAFFPSSRYAYYAEPLLRGNNRKIPSGRMWAQVYRVAQVSDIKSVVAVSPLSTEGYVEAFRIFNDHGLPASTVTAGQLPRMIAQLPPDTLLITDTPLHPDLIRGYFGVAGRVLWSRQHPGLSSGANLIFHFKDHSVAFSRKQTGFTEYDL